MKNLLILISLLFVSAINPAFAERMLDTADGHTIVLENGEVIRLWGIEAPGIYHPFGREAMDQLHTLLFNRDIELQNCRHKENRESVCKVMVKIQQEDGILKYFDTSEEMITKGLAYELSAVTGQAYAKAESNAKNEKLGIWGQSKNTLDTALTNPFESMTAATTKNRYIAEAHHYKLTLNIPDIPLKVGRNTPILEITTRAHDPFHTNTITAKTTHTDSTGKQVTIPAKVLVLPIMGEYKIEAEFTNAGKWQLEIQPTPDDEIISINLEVTNP